ncbi:MAG TPA: hypothetical protein VHC49_15415 [Mycobacteriales bacterium]|nr:hypothetical protein [Mycobacteriales bacterium]
MPKIDTIYVVNHTHHDIGYTDYQEVCRRQHVEFIAQALDLIEATADRDEPSRYRWVCEVTAPVLQFLRTAGPAQVERFRHWHDAGAIDVGAMQYNLTPALNPEQLRRSLYPVRALREEFGLTVEVAMQNDVNGAAWLLADLLPEIGVEFFTMGINQSRGRVPRPWPGAFWWKGPAGGRLLTWNGLHYLFGRSQAKLGDWRFVEESLPKYLAQFETDPDYPYDFLYCQSTHPMRVDNGPPDPRMADFVQRWNSEGRTPRIVFTTPREFGAFFRSAWGSRVPERRGDWTDWWADGVGSSAFETGLNRTTHELLGATETIAAWLQAAYGTAAESALLERIYETTTLYDEHTWGAFSSIAAPGGLPARAQWSFKGGLAYSAAMLTHDALARAAREFAGRHGQRGREGMFNLGDLATERAYPEPETDELLVVNTASIDRDLLVEVPEYRAGGAPVGMLESFFPPGVPWGGPPDSPLCRVRARVPAFGYAFVPLEPVEATDLRAEGTVIENEHYRVQVDPESGGIVSLVDKASGHDVAGSYDGRRIGEYVYETLDDPRGRDALFVNDFSDENFGYWQRDPAFVRTPARTVSVAPARIEAGRALIEVTVEADGVRSGQCVISLDTGGRAVAIDWLLDKTAVTDVESVYIAFPFALGDPEFLLDLNGTACVAGRDQLSGSCFDWYAVRRWAQVHDDRRGVTVVPLDAPLVQLGGITTNRTLDRPDPDGPAIMSWALNNHWMVNFKAAQDGLIPLRYRLGVHAPGDAAEAERFATEQSVPPIVLRDYRRAGERSGRLLRVESDAVECSIKAAEDGRGVIVRLRNLLAEPVRVPLRHGLPVRSAALTSSLEQDGAPLPMADGMVAVPVGGYSTVSVRLH